MQRLSHVFSIFAAGILSAPAFASGVTLITQATVQTSGGFPYVISQNGSYQLASNLIVPCTSGANGINITASIVVLDLNGFTISCSGTNSANGISATAGTSVTIKNGTVSGFGTATSQNSPVGYGISFQGVEGVPFVCKVDHVSVTGNGNGIQADILTELAVTESSVNNNAAYGIFAEFGFSERITDSEVSFNGLTGIVLAEGIVSGCTLVQNATFGILVALGATITNNVITNASDIGIGIAPGNSSIAGVVGYGSNTFISNGSDAPSFGGFVSMKNNVSSNRTVF